MKPKTKKNSSSAHPDTAGYSSSLSKKSPNPWAIFGICASLAAITFAAYGQTLGYGFQTYDDDAFVYENGVVIAGLTWNGIFWAFGHNVVSSWVPLTMISHMLDCQLYHLNAGGHHLTNVLLHSVSVIVLFLVLRQMTGAIWRSAFVAAVFAVHPLHVESVAWVAERKDVLSGLFFMLTLCAYVRYVRKLGSVTAYLMVVLFFIFGLMSKPMLVTLPFILLLLDFWPLQRAASKCSEEWCLNASSLLIEKIPLFLLSFLCCLVTILSQSQAIQTLQGIPVSTRIENALVSYAAYIGQMFYPVNLSVFYPYPVNGLPLFEVIGAFVLLAAISLAGILLWQKRPYILIGWLWFLIMLVPVIGMVQAGAQMRADRYTYLPQIGLYLLVAWLVTDLCIGLRYSHAVLGAAAVVVIVTLAATARTQATYWRDSESLWRHALVCTRNNSVAENNLGYVLNQKGKWNDAIVCFQKALEIDPLNAQAYNNLGIVLGQQGKLDEATACFQKALKMNPAYDEAYNNLGLVFGQKGKLDDASVCFRKALKINASYDQAYNNLGFVLGQEGKLDEASTCFQKALEINPFYDEAYNNLGIVLSQKGKLDDATVCFKKTLEINPSFAEAYNNLGNIFLTRGQSDEAITYYQKAVSINPGNAALNDHLGLAFLQKGEIDKAIAQFKLAVGLDPDDAYAEDHLRSALNQKKMGR